MNEENKKLGNSFKFTQKGLERRRYQKAGIKRQQPNKLFDTHTEGLALPLCVNRPPSNLHLSSQAFICLGVLM